MARKVGLVTVPSSARPDKARALWVLEDRYHFCMGGGERIAAGEPFARDNRGYAYCRQCRPWREVGNG